MNTESYIIYVVDTETTGFDPIENDIIELSMRRFSILEPEKQEAKTWLLKAMNPSSISDEALAINNHKREDIVHQSEFGKANYLLPSIVIPDVEKWMAEDDVSILDRIFAGQNPYFDIDFMQNLWKKEKTESTFPFSVENGNRTIDTKQIAIIIDLCSGIRRTQYNLTSLVKAFKVKKGKAHSAPEDVRMTTDLLITMLNGFKNSIGDKFKLGE